ncbi:MAG: VCBS repeat-containing protein [Deltaproteobacteria bacterium]|nr:VCBS repeat-containing protein [Deltaproteobacteria bacterium]
MKVESSSIYMASQREFISRDEEKESLRVYVDPPQSKISGEKITISAEAKCLAAECKPDEDVIEKNLAADSKMTLKALLAEILSGKKFRILDISEYQRDAEDPDITQESSNTAAAAQNQRQGWGISYDSEKSHYERETVSFAATGIIKTSDNKEIKFAIELTMQREYASYESFSFRAGDAKLTDPLVINFNGTAAELSNVRFAFDLDSDGFEEDVPLLKPGSGFLVFDINNDGAVNNGSELFGPETGNGYNELAAQDIDANNWIDENDPVYSQLYVWTMDELGGQNLSTLKQRGIGAINTGNVATMFDLKGADNELLGRTVRTGIYVNEGGAAGTIQQLDLAV